MKIDISYTKLSLYNNFGLKSRRYWIFYFKKYSHVFGFHLRVFGIHFNIREKHATEKLLVLWHTSRILNGKYKA
jgi:hypothetical protein